MHQKKSEVQIRKNKSQNYTYLEVEEGSYIFLLKQGIYKLVNEEKSV